MIELKENIHYSTSLERQILGAMIVENNAYGRCFKILGPEAFRNTSNQKIYNAIAEMWRDNLPIDHMTLFLKLCRSGFENIEGGAARYLTVLTLNVTSTATLEYSSFLLRQMYVEREILRITTSGTTGEDGLDSVRNIESELSKLRERIVVDDFKGIDEVLIQLYKHMEIVKDLELSGISTGFKELDRMTGGLQPGGMYIIGARPSVGKSAFMGKMVLAAAKSNKAVGVISLEMTDNQITARLSSLCSEIDYWRIYRNRIGDSDQAEYFYKKAAELSHLPISISDATGVNISDIKAKVARLKAKGKMDIIFIDYLQLLDSDGQNRNQNREQEVGSISRGLKLLAKDYNIPVVVLAQLNRASEQGAEKKPKLHNLRESGSLEQDADGVIFLHRDFMSGIKQDENGNSTDGQADIIIGKWRDGEVGEIKIGFDGPKMKFYEFEQQSNFKPIDNNYFN
jgi:replicative DNA helicase